jgi:hypothetical protein
MNHLKSPLVANSPTLQKACQNLRASNKNTLKTGVAKVAAKVAARKVKH